MGCKPCPMMALCRGMRCCRSCRCLLLLLVVAACSLWYITRQRPNYSKVKFIVVEEHHEVLPYWFHSTVVKALPSRGNTLLHIDGHSDLAPPLYFDGYPAFRSPGTELDIYKMMQKNDVFIQAAIMAGLLSRVIWVWPSWDKNNTAEPALTLGLGWYRPGVSSTDKHFCECSHYPVASKQEPQCSYFNDTANEELPLEPRQCSIVHRCRIDNLREDEVVSKFESDPHWIRPSESLILDVDEDFFGCESGVAPLMQAGLGWKDVTELDEAISALLCPKHSGQEELADQLLKDCTRAVIKRCRTPVDAAASCFGTTEEPLQEILPLVQRAAELQPSLFCEQEFSQSVDQFRRVLRLLAALARAQLQVVLRVGFCLNTSPATLGFVEESIGKFQVCHGVNTPNDTLVTLHTPTREEIERRLSSLSDILHSLPKTSVKLVTLCRSIRDGFTPKNFFKLIEDGIIRLVDLWLDLDPLNILYDGNLLYGAKGLTTT